jgi:hypothetical protein
MRKEPYPPCHACDADNSEHWICPLCVQKWCAERNIGVPAFIRRERIKNKLPQTDMYWDGMSRLWPHRFGAAS